MKKALIPVLCLLLALLCACGQTQPADTTDASSADESASAAGNAADGESVTWDDSEFRYLKGDLPDGWEIKTIHSTSTYLEAYYGEGDNAPRFTVSVMVYDDDMGADKTRLLADAVHARESESASEVTKSKIGGLDFYQLSYNSLLTEKTRCYVFFGQTVPDADKQYHFVEIQLDNVKDAKQYDALKSVLKSLEFKF